MARIKELRDRVAKGEATEDEKKELQELEAEANESVEEEKAINLLVEKFFSKVEAKMDAKKDQEVVEEKEIDKEVKNMDPKERTKKFIVALIQNDKATLKVMSEGTNADGGFLVPTKWHDELVEEMREDAVIRPLATVIPNAPRTLNITQLATRPQVSFRGEKSIKDTSTVGFAQITLTPYSLACIVPLTKELADDAEVGGDIISLVTRVVGTAIAEREDKAFMVGSGTLEPTGIDNYQSSVPRSVTTPANVLTADSLITGFYKLGQKYRKRAVWLMNSVTMAKVQQLKDSQGRYLFNPDITGETAGTILGRPVYEQNDLTQARIWFGDIKGYWIADRGGISVDQSEEATLTGVGNLWEQNMIAVRVEKRVDGEMADVNAFVVIKNTN